VAVFENGGDFDGELLAALVALPEADAGSLAAHLADPLDTPAMRANRAIGPNLEFNPSYCGGFAFHDVAGQDRFGHNAGFPYLNQGYANHLGLSSTISPRTTI
jgi:hypothetical protein